MIPFSRVSFTQRLMDICDSDSWNAQLALLAEGGQYCAVAP